MPSDQQVRPTARRIRRRFLGVAALILTLCLVASSALAQSIDLERTQQQRDRAEDRREQLQHELDVLLSQIEALKVTLERQKTQIKRLQQEVLTERQRAEAARERVADHYRKAYQSGTSGDALAMLFSADSVEEMTERSRVLSVLASESEREREVAEGASLRSEALSNQLEQASAVLADQEETLASHEEDAAQKVAEAKQDVEQLDRKISTEKERRAEAARRREARRDAAQQSDSGQSSSGGGAPVSGGIACPVGTPRSYSDTYGAPRSGGRVHLGVDILAPTGTPAYAYEDGAITRMDGNSLGGITLYLDGDSGNLYYYAHLNGYVSGYSPGDRVTAGEHVAYVGMTGNAPIPHLHWEVMPGGGANVNPYPYAYEACG
jgi:murein DD-endopeptidase MepM/ murein hydrolase activator NlpD